VTDSEWFQVAEGAHGPYKLHLANGERNGKNRVSGAHIVLNGSEVASPQQLNKTVKSLDVALNELIPNNHLEVTLEGPPNAKVDLIITGALSTPDP
jgi:hypothetical protein